MTRSAAWFAANDAYLSRELASLRRLLQTFDEAVAARTPRAPSVPNAEVAPRQKSWIERLFGSAESAPLPALPETSSASAPPEVAPSDDSDVAAPGPRSDSASEEGPALVTLAERLGLSEFERRTLLLCAATELDTGIGSLCAKAMGDAGRPYPTFALAMALFEEPVWDILLPERPLRYFRLVEIHQQSGQALLTSSLKADERIVNYLKGLSYVDDRLSPLVSLAASNRVTLPASQASVADAVLARLGRLGTGSELPVFQLLGVDGESKRLVAAETAARLRLSLYEIAADSIPTQANDHETFLRLWQRERVLQPLALYVDARELDRQAAQVAAIRKLLARGVGLVFLDLREPWSDIGRESVGLDVCKPTPAEQQAAWTATLGVAGANRAARLAGHFNFNLPAIAELARDADAALADSRGADAVWASCLRRARPALDQLAQPLEPKATWDDIELPPAEKRQLREIADQVGSRLAVYDEWGFRERMNRGFGISVLFAGESGTGKTMAAEVVANDLGLLLHRIDLSAVVSKYIGETEKNLRRLFDAAEEGGSILFFDEADALFGKRSEVKDSHDRYANIEINYLLQRMEAFRGLAILATNMKAALDAAFIRRLRFIVNFGFPAAEERVALWRKAFPAKTPLGPLDYARLGKLNLTGGSIHNIALNAAFLAARSRARVTMLLVLDAARAEFRKLDKPVNEADFRWLAPAKGDET
jgi:hypothetical protein